MQQAFTIVAPIFGLILLGYAAGRFRMVGPGAAKGLADFTFSLAIPAMLFKSMATTSFPGFVVWTIWIAYFGAAIATWLLAAIGTRIVLQRTPQDGVAIGMSAGFGNVVMLGIPLAISLYGPEAATTAAIVVSLHSPLLWLFASLHMAWAERGTGTSVSGLAQGLARELLGNMIILAILAGTGWRLTGWDMHPIPLRLIGLLADAGIPCALASLGLSLVAFRSKGQGPTLTLILVLKLITMPMLAWVLTRALDLPPTTAGIIILFAAMPTGANAYLFASRHGTAVNSASGAVALGTAIAAIPVSIIIYVLSGGDWTSAWDTIATHLSAIGGS